jgi:hypothetical protein
VDFIDGFGERHKLQVRAGKQPSRGLIGLMAHRRAVSESQLAIHGGGWAAVYEPMTSG